MDKRGIFLILQCVFQEKVLFFNFSKSKFQKSKNFKKCLKTQGFLIELSPGRPLTN